MGSGVSNSANMRARLIGGRYELEKVLGKGGMAVVWQARHVTLNARFAVKFLNAASAQSETTRKRFLTEAQVTAQLKTRHAVQVFDFGITDDGQPYLVMELLDGESLGQRLKRDQRLTMPTAAALMRQAARALDRAHAAGIVHRDFKPENIFIRLDEEGHEELKVVDFGVAKLVGELEADHEPESGQVAGRGALASLTRTGNMVGTPYYMAPEQIGSKEVGPAADIWAYGVVTFECLTGKVPFDGADLADLFARIRARQHHFARALNPALPHEFEEWFATACAATPAARFASATHAWEALADALGRASPELMDPTLFPRLAREAKLTPDTDAAAQPGALARARASASNPPAHVPESQISTVADEDAPAPPGALDASAPHPKVSAPWTRTIDGPPARRAPALVALAGAAVVVAGVAVVALRSPAPPSAPAPENAASLPPEASSAPLAHAAPPALTAPAPPASSAPAATPAAPSAAPLASAPRASTSASADAKRKPAARVAGATPPAAPASAARAETSPAPPPTPTASAPPSPFKLPDLGL